MYAARRSCAGDDPSARKRPRLSDLEISGADKLQSRHEANAAAPSLRAAKGLPSCDAYPLTPCLVIDEDAVKHNVDIMYKVVNFADNYDDNCDDYDADMLESDASTVPPREQRWRPHLKTTKSSRIWKILIARGVRHFKVATTLELEVLIRTIRDVSSCKRESDDESYDVLLAYPLASSASWKMLEKILKDNDFGSARETIHVSVLVDHPDSFADVPDLVCVFADLNLGMNRTGCADHMSFMYSCAQHFGERFVGVSMYEGQHAHELIGDEWAKRNERRDSCDSTYEDFVSVLEKCIAKCRASTGEARHAFVTSPSRQFEVLTSGTPSFLPALRSKRLHNFMASMGFIHRVSPGTVVLHDARGARQNPYEEFLHHACFVMATLVSKPAAHIVTCDAGSKSLACESGDPAAFVVEHPDWIPLHPSEEHLPISIPELDEWERVNRGDRILLVPEHACPTVALHAKYFVKHTLADGRHVTGDIDARGHHFGFT